MARSPFKPSKNALKASSYALLASFSLAFCLPVASFCAQTPSPDAAKKLLHPLSQKALNRKPKNPVEPEDTGPKLYGPTAPDAWRAEAENGNQDAVEFSKCMDFVENSDPAQAKTCFEREANKGYTPAVTALGKAYLEGKGVEKNTQEALTYSLRAAKAGDPEAQYNTGLLYLNSDGIMPNFHKALYYLQRSANQQYSPAEYNLAILYLKGIKGVKQNTIVGMRYLQAAADHNDAHAAELLSRPDELKGFKGE
ncbi:sel1 repeat family protein [Acetobacteraceae bacterium]|nr:sel1 repeat family protein [Acetobacteraceae bacterium]